MNDAAVLARLVRETDMDIVMLAGRYTLLEQNSLDDLLPACAERGVAVVAAGVFNSGILARPEPPERAKYDYVDAPADFSSGRARSRASASGTAQRCPRQQSRSRSRIRRWSAFASARGVRSRSS